jgi:sugar-specific transcriptional regulator TrmB
MKQEETGKILQKIGLDELEISCYFALLRQSPQKASDLCKKLDVPKATILSALYRLSDELGIIRKSKKKNSFLFLVEDAKDLLSYIERKEEEMKNSKTQIENILPELRSMQSYDVKKPQIFYYEGKDGIRQAFEKVLEEADEIIGYGSNEDDRKYTSELYPHYYERRVKRKIPVKAIVPALPFNVFDTLENSAKHLRETHLVDKEWNYPIQVNVYKNTSVFYSFEESFALMIKSKPISDCLKKIFELAFDGTKDLDKNNRSRIE